MGEAEHDRARAADRQHAAMLDDIADIAARALDCPIAVIGLVDTDRLWRSRSVTAMPDVALGGVAVTQDDPWVVDHAAVDPRTLVNPVIADALGLRFHTGVPLRSPAGYDLGMLAVMDRAPRTISAGQMTLLKKLAGLAVHMLEMRLTLRMATRAADQKITSAA